MNKRLSNMHRKISFVAAVFWIVTSTVIFVGLSYAVLRYYHQSKRTKRWHDDPRQRIVKILQTGPEKEALSTLYLAELLQLSIDRPVLSRSFDSKKAEARLCASPVIEHAKVSFVTPNTILVDYIARRPIAWLYDYKNIGIDESCTPFPIHPFFSPKKLPEIYLGEPIPLVWNQPLDHPKIRLALSIHRALLQAPFFIHRIDVSQAFAESYGKRQIILLIEESFKIPWQQKEILCLLPRILRLSTTAFQKELGNYIVLRDETLTFDPSLAKFESDRIASLPEQVIDLRIADMGFIK
jgi:hypothetical protein